MMKLHIWGGAGEHGRSCYLIIGEQHRILFDCGVKKEGTGQYPLLDPEQVSQLTAVFLSHAHEDHSMALPLLYKYGYKGDIWTTRATVEQLDSYFSSWRHYVEERDGTLPFDEKHHAAMTFRYLEDYAPECRWFELSDHLRLKWGRSGHLIGSVWLRLELEGQKLFFSGDYSRESQLLMADSPAEKDDGDSQSRYVTDLSIMDNAYGMEEEPQQTKLEQLNRAISKTLQSGGHLLLPVPAFGRGQEMLIWACESFAAHTIIVEKNIWLGLQRMLEQPLWLRPEGQERIRRVISSSIQRIVVPENDEQRQQAMTGQIPCIIFASDGMMESPQIRCYFDQLSGHAHNAVILTGHTYKYSFARRILEEDMKDVKCGIRYLCYKVHQGIADVRVMLEEAPSAHTVLVHAPKEETDRVWTKLTGEGFEGLYSLEAGTELKIV